jgi:hypothetical protein
MQDIYRLIIGTFILFLGIPIGNFLAKTTKEELNQGKKWFKLIIISSLIGAIISLILKNDTIMFFFLFTTVVTSCSLKNG